MVRHRIGIRRGGTRGGSSHPPTKPHPEPTASSPSPELHHPQRHGAGRYPSTKSGRSHARSSGVVHGYFAVHSTNFPLPLHPSPQSTQFKFYSTLNRPVITTTISILFIEDNAQTTSQVDNSNLRQEVSPRCNNCRDTGKNVMDEGFFTLHGKNLDGN